MLAVRRTWAESRVDCCDDSGAVLTLSLAWTSLAEVDPYTVINAGRAPFRVRELLAVVALVARHERVGPVSERAKEERDV